MCKKILLLSVLTSIVLVTISVHAQASQNTGTAFIRARHLQHGINASEWFAQSDDYSAKRLTAYTTMSDIELMKKLGFDHVRLSVDPRVVQCLWQEQPCEPVQILDGVVAKCLELDLAVIVDIHPTGEYKRQLGSDDTAVEKFAALWTQVALHYGKNNADRIFFEIMNEPELRDPYRWASIQRKVVLAVRKAAPWHTIIVSGTSWSDIEDLIVLEPLADANLIYNFHYYEPHIFTHQGATWGEFYWTNLHKVPYPSSLEAVQVGMLSIQSNFARWQLTKYGLERWDHERINGDIAFVADWARTHGVPLTCNEFGVYRTYSEASARAAWLGDVRRAFEKNGIGWTMWDYQGGFGVVKKDGKDTAPDQSVLEALGLAPHKN